MQITSPLSDIVEGEHIGVYADFARVAKTTKLSLVRVKIYLPY